MGKLHLRKGHLFLLILKETLMEKQTIDILKNSLKGSNYRTCHFKGSKGTRTFLENVPLAGCRPAGTLNTWARDLHLVLSIERARLRLQYFKFQNSSPSPIPFSHCLPLPAGRRGQAGGEEEGRLPADIGSDRGKSM
jgi:hypothetical protein